MLKFHKFISVILHPVVIPTIGVLLFLLITPDFILKRRQYLLISIVFFSTYIIPLITLFVLKTLGSIHSFQVKSIKERKIPIYIMLVIFYILGRMLIAIPEFKDLGLLFYGTDISLLIIYILFYFNIKTSLHVMSLSSLLGFLLLYGNANNLYILPIVIVTIFLIGLLASARLSLKAHTPLEIYLGFFLGITSQILSYLIL